MVDELMGRVRVILDREGVTQTKLASEMGSTQETIAAYLSGRSKAPYGEMTLRLLQWVVKHEELFRRRDQYNDVQRRMRAYLEERDQARAALERYGQHTLGCNTRVCRDWECDCGFYTAIVSMSTRRA